MSYIETNVIGPNEHIQFTPQKCLIPLFWSWVFGILFFWLLFIPLVKAIQKNIEITKTEYAVTDKKVIEKTGLFSVVCDEMKLDKNENITLYKTFWGKVFNYGDVHIQGTNRNHINFYGIKDAEIIKSQLSRLISE